MDGVRCRIAIGGETCIDGWMCSAGLGKRCTHVSDLLGSGGENCREGSSHKSLSEIQIDVDVKMEMGLHERILQVLDNGTGNLGIR